MILPTKHLAEDRALLSVGALVLRRLSSPRSVSSLWEDLKKSADQQGAPLPYDWFVLSLDLLFILGAVEFRQGQLRRATR